LLRAVQELEYLAAVLGDQLGGGAGQELTVASPECNEPSSAPRQDDWTAFDGDDAEQDGGDRDGDGDDGPDENVRHGLGLRSRRRAF
jgi:hypothetical protein